MANMQIVRNPRTEVDVQRLCEVFPDLLPDGRQIRHEQLEALLSANRASARYRTVVQKWRKRVFEDRRVYLDGRAALGAGFIALTPDEMVNFGIKGVREVGRKLKKALAVMSAPDDAELDEANRRRRGILEAAVLKLAAEQRHTLRDISKALAPPMQLPRATPGAR